MTPEDAVGELDRSVGYVLKQAQATLHAGMDGALRPLGLTVPQYACLELLGRQPDLSGSELARRAFVTRQSMNLVLRRLQERDLLTRPDQAREGRARPTRLTGAGRAVLHEASVAVRAVERQLFAPLSPQRQQTLREDLASCVHRGR